MPIARRDPAWRRARPWLSAATVVTLMLAAMAAPVLAQDRPTRASDGASTSLRDPRVSLRIARPTSTIRFSVTYRDRDGSPPAAVRVVIDGHPRAMAPVTPSTHYQQGVRFVVATKLPAGRHRVRFEAVSAAGGHSSVRGGFVRIVARRASGSSSGGAAASTGKSDGPAPGSDDRSAGDSRDPVATDPAAGPAGGSGPGAAAEDAPDSGMVGGDTIDADGIVPSGSVAGEVGTDLPSTTSPAPVAVARVADDSAPSGGATSRPSGGGDTRGRVALASVDPLKLLGVPDSLFDRVFRATPVMITTTGTVVVWAAFVFFGKRRRDGDPPAPDAVLAANAASGPEPIPVERLVPPIVPADLPPGVDPTEAGLPRWRRPSLLQARKTDPLRTAVTTASLTFADGAVEPYDGLERRRIRYRLVRLLDVPDDVRSTEIGILDEGDEVQVLDTYGAYRLVLCPDGQEGWLHRMVLGDVVDDSSEVGPDGIDEDVLAAYLAIRAKSA